MGLYSAVLEKPLWQLNKIGVYFFHVIRSKKTNTQSCWGISMILLPKSSASLYTVSESNLADRGLGEVEKDSFIALPGKGGHRGFLPRKTMCLNRRGFDEGVYNNGSRVGVSDRIIVYAGIATNSSTLAWKIPWTEEPGRLHSPWGRKESKHDWATSLFTLHYILISGAQSPNLDELLCSLWFCLWWFLGCSSLD